jgi:hypothetical protein
LPSLQLSGVPGWQPLSALQVSAPLQALPSLQSALFGWLEHESVASLQVSVVQDTPSLQTTPAPPTQFPP